MIPVRWFAAAFASLALMAAAAAPTTLTVRPVMAEGRFAAMDVAVSFQGDADGDTTLKLPDAWGGETALWRALSDVRAEGAAVEAGAGPALRRLRHPPGARITVRYRVRDLTGERGDKAGADYRPLIRPGHFQLLGNAVVALPEGARMRDPARFRMEGAPAGMTFASDLEHARPGGLTVADLVESILVGGDYRVLDAGGGLRVAIRGAWPRDDAGWRAQIARIGAVQRDYWGAGPEPFLVTLSPVSAPPETLSIGGTGRGDAFAVFATANAPPARLDRLLAHEMMHTWISARVGGLDDADEQLGYWLSEGFTDWAAFRTSVRGALWTPEQFAEAFNESLTAYDRSTVRTAPNARILAEFWSSEEVQRLPYRRGLLLATLWDAQVRAASGGRHDLDDVLLAMQRAAARRGDVSARQIFPVVMRRFGVDVGVALTTLVGEGAPVDLPAAVFAPCGMIEARVERIWERGFDFEATRRADWVIAGVREGSSAWRAGLRNGMRLRQWSETAGDRVPDRPMTAGVTDGGVARAITWLPAGEEARAVRRLVLDPAMDRAACVRRLSGL
ncbi:MAG: hypothetical protein NW200_06220 [Hyphomonadaceae bacterium]|nr:hypothetical protein [Hyphomonadaceae bacterium]